MNTTSSTRRPAFRLASAAAAASLAVLLGASTAAAAPIPITTVSHDHHAHGCSTDLHELVANFRAHGFTAQAANNAAQLTRQACLYG